MNIELKIAVIRRFRSQVEASKELGIRENRLSYLVRGHVEPNDRERDVLRNALGADYFQPQPPEAA
jgi:hypothetical protein